MIITMEHFINFFGKGEAPGEEKTVEETEARILATMAKHKNPESIIRLGFGEEEPEQKRPADMFLINGCLPFKEVAQYTKTARANVNAGGIVMWTGYEHTPNSGAARVIDEINALEGNFIAQVEGSRICFCVKSEPEQETEGRKNEDV